MKNPLKLHEAVAVVLLSMPDKKSTFEAIADVIEKRGLFPIRKGGITLAKQIELRTTITSSRYKHFFNFITPNFLQLK
ncbi:hypothetical protein [Sediminibacterium ginsengisoli]|uniref:hypothetical protein n=1 Tax=Sediminibacterium ginsengisoli TaxID=413434 RepID=UPI00111665DB|nr:hypothetical protein [Sediminibacterium ginsengisoli]